MPDDTAPPVSTTVPETITVDTGASPEDLGKLKDDFKDFWAEQDDEQPQPKAPEAPGPAQETKKETTAAEKPVAKSEPEIVPGEIKEIISPAKDYTDEEIDKLELVPNQRPEVYEQFKAVKDKWKADRAMLRAEKERHRAMEGQLAEARANQLTPEVKADYEHAASIRRKFDLVSDPDFIARFDAPIVNRYQDLLDEVASKLYDPREGARWAADVKQRFGSPDKLADSLPKQKDWWQHSVIAMVPDEMDREAIRSQVNELLKLQKDRSSEIQNRANDSASFDNYIQEKAALTHKRVQEEIMSEIGVQEARIKDVLPRDVTAAKTKEERAAIEEHNERFQKLNEFFVDTLKDISANGPRAWVRAAVEATRTKIMNDQITNLEKELKEAKSERDQFKGELEKITGARRKLSHTTGTPPAPSGAKQNGQGLSVKDLDIRKSFKNYDWGDR
jgi:hypothetical protein